MPGHGNASLKYDKAFLGGALIVSQPGSSSANQFANRTVVASNPQVVTALPGIQVQDLIFLQPMRVGGAGVSSVAYACEVSCIQAGSGFHITTVAASGTNASSLGIQVAWMVVHRPPIA